MRDTLAQKMNSKFASHQHPLNQLTAQFQCDPSSASRQLKLGTLCCESVAWLVPDH